MSTHPTDPTGRASDAELVAWAEHDMVLAKDSPTALRGEQASGLRPRPARERSRWA